MRGGSATRATIYGTRTKTRCRVAPRTKAPRKSSDTLGRIALGVERNLPMKKLKGPERCSVADGSGRPRLSYAVEQRLRLIDFLLRQYGHINRSALIDFFGIGERTATRDLKAYLKIAPKNAARMPADQTYHRTMAFVSVWE